MSKDQASMKRQATHAELHGEIGPDGIVPASSKNNLSLALPGMEPRLSRKTSHMAPMMEGITKIEYGPSGQYPECTPFKVWED
jgi:hypothetical protein